MSYFKRILLHGSIGAVLLTGLMLTVTIGASSTAFARADACNSTAIGTWSNNCQTSEGNISNFVYAIQETIDESRTPCGANIDGDFGPQTFTAVECFQSHTPGLSVDGIVGPQTWGALQNTLTFDHTAGGWFYYHGQIFSTVDYRQSSANGGWQMFVVPRARWCTINLNSPC
jgi:hypothetical protein